MGFFDFFLIGYLIFDWYLILVVLICISLLCLLCVGLFGFWIDKGWEGLSDKGFCLLMVFWGMWVDGNIRWWVVGFDEWICGCYFFLFIRCSYKCVKCGLVC